MSCLIQSTHNMLMDVYDQTKIIDPDSGEVAREWESIKDPNVPCVARGIQGGGIRVVGSTERWSDIYEDVEIVRIQTGYPLKKSQRVRNIRAADGTIAWTEDDGTPTKFEVVGSSAIFDPFGYIVQYDSLLTRADKQ